MSTRNNLINNVSTFCLYAIALIVYTTISMSMTIEMEQPSGLDAFKNRCDITNSKPNDTLFYTIDKYYLENCKYSYTIKRVRDVIEDSILSQSEHYKITIREEADNDIHSVDIFDSFYSIYFVDNSIIIQLRKYVSNEIKFLVLKNGIQQEYSAPPGKYTFIGRDNSNLYYQSYQYDFDFHYPHILPFDLTRTSGALTIKGFNFFSVNSNGIKKDIQIAPFLLQLDTTYDRVTAERMSHVNEKTDSVLLAALLHKDTTGHTLISSDRLIYYCGSYAVIQKRIRKDGSIKMYYAYDIYNFNRGTVKKIGTISDYFVKWAEQFYYSAGNIYMQSFSKDSYQIHKISPNSVSLILDLADFPKYFYRTTSLALYKNRFEVHNNTILFFNFGNNINSEEKVFTYSALTKEIHPLYLKELVK